MKAITRVNVRLIINWLRLETRASVSIYYCLKIPTVKIGLYFYSKYKNNLSNNLLNFQKRVMKIKYKKIIY